MVCLGMIIVIIMSVRFAIFGRGMQNCIVMDSLKWNLTNVRKGDASKL